MPSEYEPLYASLVERIGSYGVEVREESLGPETPGKFDGVSITMNPDYDLESRCYFLAHSLGSIVLWGLDFAGSQTVFDELRSAKKRKENDLAGFARALAKWVA